MLVVAHKIAHDFAPRSVALADPSFHLFPIFALPQYPSSIQHESIVHLLSSWLSYTTIALPETSVVSAPHVLIPLDSDWTYDGLTSPVSPFTWACYERIHDDEDDEDNEGADDFSYSADAEGEHPVGGADVEDSVAHEMEMEVDAEGPGVDGEDTPNPMQTPAQLKDKQRVVNPVPSPPKRRPRKKQPRPLVYTLRPILTIQCSQGFVWNQDLFVPPYIKDRYVASTSPPNSTSFISTSVSSTNSALPDYEVEVVEIRVTEGEFDGIIP
ncbi:hypothetical protein B0H19DRAFT_1253293 [Mycena capillaripes]|nr:hypothetical protein B0H19DRAFT_1253293 [Mycena capillaripes]